MLLRVQDPALKTWVETYAKDNTKFTEDFATAFQKLQENGHHSLQNVEIHPPLCNCARRRRRANSLEALERLLPSNLMRFPFLCVSSLLGCSLLALVPADASSGGCGGAGQCGVSCSACDCEGCAPVKPMCNCACGGSGQCGIACASCDCEGCA